MPWTGEEFRRRHNLRLSGKSASKAASIANRILAETGNEGEAIRTANSRVRLDYGKKLKAIKARRNRGVS